MDNKQVNAAVQVLAAIIETVEEMHPQPVPKGVVYAALMNSVSLNAFNSLIEVGVKAGRLKHGPMDTLEIG